VAKKNVIGKKIKAFRLDRQMTQKRLAGFLGVSVPTIKRMERGEGCSDLMRAKIEKAMSQVIERFHVLSDPLCEESMGKP
jgi:DNA-binding XRE family transcriptional regulator